MLRYFTSSLGSKSPGTTDSRKKHQCENVPSPARKRCCRQAAVTHPAQTSRAGPAAPRHLPSLRRPDRTQPVVGIPHAGGLASGQALCDGLSRLINEEEREGLDWSGSEASQVPGCWCWLTASRRCSRYPPQRSQSVPASRHMAAASLRELAKKCVVCTCWTAMQSDTTSGHTQTAESAREEHKGGVHQQRQPHNLEEEREGPSERGEAYSL